jgi:hypothetical protein
MFPAGCVGMLVPIVLVLVSIAAAIALGAAHDVVLAPLVFLFGVFGAVGFAFSPAWLTIGDRKLYVRWMGKQRKVVLSEIENVFVFDRLKTLRGSEYREIGLTIDGPGGFEILLHGGNNRTRERAERLAAEIRAAIERARERNASAPA